MVQSVAGFIVSIVSSWSILLAAVFLGLVILLFPLLLHLCRDLQTQKQSSTTVFLLLILMFQGIDQQYFS